MARAADRSTEMLCQPGVDQEGIGQVTVSLIDAYWASFDISGELTLGSAGTIQPGR